MRYVFAVAVIAAALVSTAGAGAAGPPTAAGLVFTLEVIYTPTDAAGKPTGPPQVFHEPKGPPSFVDEQAAKGVGASSSDRSFARMTGDGGTPSYSGCGAHESILTAKDILKLFVVYKYHVKRYWCWNYGHRVTSASTKTPWFTNLDPNFYVVSVSLSPHGWFYTWCCGDSRSGHYAFRQGQVNNCIFKYGCIGTTYPTIEIWLHGNGTWHDRKDY
jgi:hypothetical protein